MSSLARNKQYAVQPTLPFRNKSRGVTLIEILVAILVMAVALLALANLQTKISRSASNAKGRTVAVYLAEQQIETMRNYDAVESGFGTAAFEDIADSTSTLLSTVAGTNYSVSWLVTDYWFDVTGANLLTSAPVVGQTPDFKAVTVTADWQDVSDDPNTQVVVRGIISSVDPTQSGRLVAGGSEHQKPIAEYRPGYLPEVVPIMLGNDLSRESTGLSNVVINKGSNIVSKFDVVTYNNTNNREAKRDQFTVVNCVCELVGTGSGATAGYAPTLWDGEEYVLGEPVDGKMTGATVRQGQLGGQPLLCDTCCRDHHDKSGVSEYDPFRPNSDKTNAGNHKHYFPNNSGDLVEVSTLGKEYLEACRFIRKDGFQRLTTDLRLENLITFPQQYTQVNSLDYAAASVDFVNNYVSSLPNNYPAATPAVPFNLASAPTTVAFSTLANQEQLQSRGLYMDYHSPELLTLIGGDVLGNLDKIPFFDINLERVANWSASEIDTLGNLTTLPASNFLVTNDPIRNIDQTGYSRGLASNLTGGTGPEGSLSARVERSNTGIIDVEYVDVDDAPADINDVDAMLTGAITAVPALISPAPDVVVIFGGMKLNNNVKDIQPSDVVVTGSNGAICVKPTQDSYRCALTRTVAGGPGVGTITMSNYNTESTVTAGDVNNRTVDFQGFPVATAVSGNACLNEATEFIIDAGDNVTTDDEVLFTIKAQQGGSC